MIEVFEQIFKGIPKVADKGYTINKIVTMFEKCLRDELRNNFDKLLLRGNRYFDDVKTGIIASNFEKVNIIKEISDERYTKKLTIYKNN